MTIRIAVALGLILLQLAPAFAQENETKERLSAADVQRVTGIAYGTSSQPANFPNIKHWEFREGVHVVGLLIATGETAIERMKNEKRNKHSAISNFLDEAIWEPIRGQLTARSGDRCVEVRISKSHGTEAQRLDQSKALAKLLLDRN